ncbi:hypothetical protein GYMLUDRAFT_949278 [Collybiopsis luxurians FD-317 M1]|nr:hypothetical protein GYMLUDRAFT_949278 [Collybiopsis luxurians FD-317 M1]
MFQTPTSKSSMSVLPIVLVLLPSMVKGQVTNGTGVATILPAGPAPITGGCGTSFNADDQVAGVPTSVFSSGDVCSKSLSVTYQGKTLQFPIVDECTSCNQLAISLAAAAFAQYEPEKNGVLLQVDWDIVD